MFFKLLFSSLFLFGGAAYAAVPTLSSNIIQGINTDKAFYQVNDEAHVSVYLNNKTGASFSGNITATVYGRGVQVGEPINASISAIAAGASSNVLLRIPVSQQANYQGYLVKIVVTNSSGTQIDQQSTAIDESPDWWTYPRQCWFAGAFTNWGGWNPSTIYGDPESDVDGLNAMKCNNIQVYNVLYRWHQPYPGDETYTNGDGEDISVNLLREAIASAKKRDMGTLMYMPIYSANKGIAPTFQNDGSGVSLDWAAFTNDCGSTSSCTVSDVWDDTFSNIAIMNGNNTNWQEYWARQAKNWQKYLGFDGMFGDTYGTINTPLWDNTGTRITNDTMYSSFITNITNRTNMPMVINPAGSYNEQDLVQSGREAYHFVERWNNSSDIGNFGDFLTKARQVWGWANRKPNNIGLDWDMGLNKTLGASSTCSINGGSTACTFNTPGVLYQEAADLATGAHHAWIVDGQQNQGDGVRYISNDDFPIGNMLSPDAAMTQGEYDYQTFGVAYEKLLRLNISASTLADPTITSGATGSTTAAAGKVWLFQNHRSGFDILHMLNYQQMSATSFSDVNDNAANAAEPTMTGAVQVKMYYTTGGTLGDLYVASPDVNHGVSEKLSYTTGSDASGSFITFTVPSLKYWDMIWLENDVSNSDYAVN